MIITNRETRILPQPVLKIVVVNVKLVSIVMLGPFMKIYVILNPIIPEESNLKAVNPEQSPPQLAQ
jgi:hypothetical protein